MEGMNGIYQKRGQPFAIADYPEATRALLREKLLPVEEIIDRMP